MPKALVTITTFLFLGACLVLGNAGVVQAQEIDEECFGPFCIGFGGSTGGNGDQPGTLAEFIERIIDLVLMAIPILMILALLAFMFGATKLIYNSGDPRKVTEG